MCFKMEWIHRNRTLQMNTCTCILVIDQNSPLFFVMRIIDIVLYEFQQKMYVHLDESWLYQCSFYGLSALSFENYLCIYSFNQEKHIHSANLFIVFFADLRPFRLLRIVHPLFCRQWNLLYRIVAKGFFVISYRQTVLLSLCYERKK